MRAIGLYAGIGTMLHEARSLGFDIVGNVDPRPRKHYPLEPWLWEANFAGVPLYASLDAARADDDLKRVDLALGHPPCGAHSALGRTAGADPSERARRGTEALATFTRLVRITKPTMFAMENLPKILATVAPEVWWREELRRYRLTFVTIVNWDYGCVQRRERLWIIGARRGVVSRFRFRPIKRRPEGAPTGVLAALGGLPSDPSSDVPDLAHVHDRPDDRPFDCYRVGRRKLETVRDVARRFRALPPNQAWRYLTADGREVRKAGHVRLPRTGATRVMSGGPTLMHPVTGWPLTPRERARLMGWPDDFKLTDGRAVDRTLRYKLAFLTGRGVPSDFLRYLLPQLRHHLERSA